MRYFLIYTNGSSPEDYSVFYSTLVIAEDENEAAFKYCLRFDTSIFDFMEEFTEEDYNEALQDEYYFYSESLPLDYSYLDIYEAHYGIEELDPIM